MTSQQLPERANLEQLKKQAKSLLQAAQAKDPSALQRFLALPALARKSVAELSAVDLALHDAQSVLAREYGFASWKELRERVEEQSLSFAAAAEEFVRCATGGAQARAFRLLAQYPAIAGASMYTALVLGDVEAVRARLEKHPEAALQPGGPQNWEPLLYVCHTCLHHGAPERAAGLVAIARELLRRGTNPNAEYHWNWHRELPRTALWGALCAVNHLPLAEVLLEGGANPTDGVSTHITAGSGNLAALELLHRFDVNVNGIPGGVPPLRYILSWTRNTAGVRWLLEHGADPKLAWNEPGDAPLHIAAERWDVPMVELLVRHGADIHQRRADGRTAHTLAELHGNREIAAWLLAHGAADERSPLERFVSACARGDRPAAEAMLQAHPHLRGELRAEHHLMMHVPAERGDAAILETMLACGFDPNVKDHDGVTSLHRAAMAGRPEAVRVLLAHGASLQALDGMFSATPLVWAAEGWSHHPENADHLEVARLLIAAGSPLDWIPPEKAPDPEGTHENLAAFCRAAT
ncbi:MAG TPA: ankyrin repeat domain-containing protein [Bryobacteraceae bacterium]|nr:ankyrin repeat domain-containing protein [Bryobacteraceae bacterium]